MRFSPLMPSQGLLWLFHEAETMAVGDYHGDRFGFEDQRAAPLEGVAGFFIGDGEDGAGGNEVFKTEPGILRLAMVGSSRTCGMDGGAQADHLGVAAAGADLDPVVVEGA